MTNSDQPTARNQKQRDLYRSQPSTHREPVETSAVQEQVQPYLQVENVQKKFGEYIALRDIYLDVYPGEFVCLLGPSGCGKTTLLRIIAGLEQQTSGRIIQNERDISNLPPSQRDFGIVFQSYALFPNLTAAQNIAYGLENTKKSKQTIKMRVEELLALVGLEGLGPKYPSQMSGGQQQRVALARALALSPGLLLLDEPLSALDAQVRVRLRSEIAQLQRRLGVTTVMVTHDQEEALAMADRIVVMGKGGYLAQVGTPQSVYHQPITPFVANFIGVMSFLSGIVTAPEQVRCGNLNLHAPRNDFPTDAPVRIAVRPEDIRLLDQTNLQLEGTNVLTAEVEELEFLGSKYLVTIRPSGDSKEKLVIELSIREAQQIDLSLNSALTIQLPPELIRVFEAA